MGRPEFGFSINLALISLLLFKRPPTTMIENEFWSRIGKIDLKALNAGAEDDAVQPLIENLAKLKPSEIEQFEECLARHLYSLDGKVYAERAGRSGESGDGFLYARCFVVASGRAFYETVLADPSSFPDSIEKWCEPLLYVAQRAWAEVTGKSEEDWNYFPSVSYETGSNTERWR
jgi:hypothetical protein